MIVDKIHLPNGGYIGNVDIKNQEWLEEMQAKYGDEALKEMLLPPYRNKSKKDIDEKYLLLINTGIEYSLTVEKYPLEGGGQGESIKRNMIFSLSAEARADLMAVGMAINSGRPFAPYSDMAGFCFDLLAEEYNDFSNTILAFYVAITSKKGFYSRWIERADNIEEIESISWLSSLPPDLQTVFLTHLERNGVDSAMVELIEAYILAIVG